LSSLAHAGHFFTTALLHPTLIFRAGLVIAALPVIVCTAAAAPGHQVEAAREFNIPAGDAATTLRQLSAQAAVELLYSTEAVAGVQTRTVRGHLSPLEALAQLLRDTPLQAQRHPATGGFAIVRPKGADRRPTAPPPRPRDNAASDNAQPSSESKKPMKPTKSSGLLSLLAGWLAFAPAETDAQTAKTPALPSRDEVVALSPFEVNTSRDTSYGALNSTSISAFNMPLLQTPVAVDIFTEEFMRDMATTNVEELFANYGAGVGQVLANPAGESNSNQPGDYNERTAIGSRGVAGSTTRRNGFATSGTNSQVTDSFDMERVEMIKGANATLFGASGAGGIVNTTSKSARFGTAGRPRITSSLSSRIDQYGSKRWQLDANYGLKNLAYRFVILNEEVSFRRLFLTSATRGIYGTIAANLPLNTTLRLSGRRTDNERILSSSVGNLSFTNATRDPRHNFSLEYLLATNQAGATNPKTGAAYPAGVIANGRLTWENAGSWGGSTLREDGNGDNVTLTVDTTWSKWLSTSIGAMYDRLQTWRGTGAVPLLAPRAFNATNPFDEWASGSTYTVTRNQQQNTGIRTSYRGNAVITRDLFKGRAKTQSVLGWELSVGEGVGSGQGNVSYRYYEADGSFRIFDQSNPRPAALGGVSGSDALGRVAMPTLYWPVSGGPIKEPHFRTGSRRVTVDGRNFVLVQQNPRNSNWVTQLNPLGLLSLVPGYASIGGSNFGDDGQLSKNWGLYGANYVRWLDDRFTTLLGYRYSKTFTRLANSSLDATQGWADTDRQHASYSLGLSYRLRPTLYAYSNLGRTFEPTTRSPDFYGNPPRDTIGFNREIGFKYEPANTRVSGSISYYLVNSKNENFTYGAYTDIINPLGLNGGFNPSLRNGWVPLDKESRGIEVILTAAPTRNWRARLGFTQQDGTIRTATAYPILWNDEFYYNKATGGVTYSDGTPLMVPTDVAGISTVNTISTLRAPVAGTGNTQLTVAMMSDRTSPYYAYGQGGTTQTNGRIANNSTVFRALRYFQIPSGGQFIQARTLRTGLPVSDIPYVFDDPAGLNGVVEVASSGEPTVGHPLYRFVLTNTYDFTEGWLRGTTIGATVRWDVDKSNYWYTEPNGKGGTVRKLFKEADLPPQVNLTLGYSRKFGRYGFRTQMNVNNLFNTYLVEVRPAPTTGYTVEDALTATFVGQPRQYVWTNTVSF
jgi:outer membrane receptor protein involved in Fe transport